ncbi:hypothetical protein CDD81_4100 [Ophiocordyceps australis]|uniref:Uncharacterized protein n=1 Tax=Ophiocordyceps australis TaxID=1399860 RepID=A0A2C5XAH7_9HYPO|nr:hypothetical protein CDD81_4100 [Ophiocordyceps australis]
MVEGEAEHEEKEATAGGAVVRGSRRRGAASRVQGKENAQDGRTRQQEKRTMETKRKEDETEQGRHGRMVGVMGWWRRWWEQPEEQAEEEGRGRFGNWKRGGRKEDMSSSERAQWWKPCAGVSAGWKRGLGPGRPLPLCEFLAWAKYLEVLPRRRPLVAGTTRYLAVGADTTGPWSEPPSNNAAS